MTQALAAAWGRWAALAAAAGCVAGCSVDTELGLDAVVEQASVSVTGSGDAAVIGVQVGVRLRVGEHAMGERDFALVRAELIALGQSQALVSLERPPGFDGVLAPGSERLVQTMGRSEPGAFPGAGPVLCAGDEVTVLVHYRDRTSDEAGIAERGQVGVRCD